MVLAPRYETAQEQNSEPCAMPARPPEFFASEIVI
jgi:hypothetical protein